MRFYQVCDSRKPVLPFGARDWPSFSRSERDVKAPIILLDSRTPKVVDDYYAKFCFEKFIPSRRYLIPKLIFLDRLPWNQQIAIDTRRDSGI